MKNFVEMFEAHETQVLFLCYSSRKRFRADFYLQLAEKWYAELDKGTKTLDVIPWFHKATLDMIGESQ